MAFWAIMLPTVKRLIYVVKNRNTLQWFKSFSVLNSITVMGNAKWLHTLSELSGLFWC